MGAALVQELHERLQDVVVSVHPQVVRHDARAVLEEVAEIAMEPKVLRVAPLGDGETEVDNAFVETSPRELRADETQVEVRRDFFVSLQENIIN